MDNAAAERALRIVALGRSYVQFRIMRGAAAIYTLLGTARLNTPDPELYLRHVLERIADHPINRNREFLPWNLAALPTRLT